MHTSTLVCPITTQVQPEMDLLRVHLRKNQLEHPSDVLVDQLRAIDNKRFLSKIGKLNGEQVKKMKENIKNLLDMQTG